MARSALAAALALTAAACAGPAAGVRPAAGGAVVLRVPADGATLVTLAGTMNGWQPEPLFRVGGAFEIALRLPPGRYEYRLEAQGNPDGPRTVFPEGCERVPDGFGGENAVLRIR